MRAPVDRHRLAAFAALWLLCGLANGQEARDLSLSESISVEAVQIDVVVKSRGKTRADNLGEEAFRILVDGRRTPTRYFEAVSPSACDDTVVIVVDNRHLPQLGRNELLAGIEAFVADLATRGCGIMALTYDGSILQQLERTTDAQAVVAALGRLRTMPGTPADWSKGRTVPLRYVSDTVRSFSGFSGADDFLPTLRAMWNNVQGFAAAEHADAEAFVGALEQLTAALGTIDGHKRLLLVTDGVALQPFDVLLDTFLTQSRGSRRDDATTQFAEPALGNKLGSSSAKIQGGRHPMQDWARGLERFNLSGSLARLAEVANASRVSVYPLPATESFIHEVDPANQYRFSGQRFATSDLDAALKVLAALTGGRLHNRSGDPAQFVEQLIPTTEARYVLGFDSPAADAGFRSVKIKVRGKGLRTEHRPGYATRDLNEKLAARALSALVLGNVSNRHRLAVSFDSMEKISPELSEVSLLLAFPIGEIELTPTGRQHEADLWVTAAYVDELGNVAQMKQVPAPLVVPNRELDEARSQDFAVLLSLTMTRGVSEAVVGVWNRTTGADSFITGEIRVQE